MNNNDNNLKPSQNQLRQRSSAFGITSISKERMSKDIGHLGFIQDESQKEQYIQYIETKFGKNTSDKIEESDFLEIAVPKFKGLAKNVKPKTVCFNESSRTVDLGIKYDNFEPKESRIDFKILMNQFDENTIDEFEIQDLLKYDFEEEIPHTKDKLNELIDKISVLVQASVENSEDNQRRSQLLVFLCNKLNVWTNINNIYIYFIQNYFLSKKIIKELKICEKQIKIMVNNIDKVKELNFLEDKIKINYFD